MSVATVTASTTNTEAVAKGAEIPLISVRNNTASSKRLRISGVALNQLGAMALGIQTGLVCAGFAASAVGLSVAGGALILGLFLIALGHKEKSRGDIAFIVSIHAAIAIGTFVTSLLTAYCLGYLDHVYSPAFHATESLAKEAAKTASEKIAAEALIPGSSVYDQVAGGTGLLALRHQAGGSAYNAVMSQHGYSTFLIGPAWGHIGLIFGGIMSAGLAMTSCAGAIAFEYHQD